MKYIPFEKLSISDTLLNGLNDKTDDLSAYSELLVPASVTNVVTNAFSQDNPSYASYNPAFQTGGSITKMSFDSNSDIYGIASYAFQMCRSLQSVSFLQTNTMNLIGLQAFNECNAITTLILPANISSITDSAFGGSTLQPVSTIPNLVIENVTDIGEQCFNCRELSVITFTSKTFDPEGLESDAVFYHSNKSGNPVTIYYPSDSTYLSK
jgi:hypothetical protein